MWGVVAVGEPVAGALVSLLGGALRAARALRDLPGRRRAPGALPARYRLHGVELFPGIGVPLSRTTRYGATFAGVQRGEPAALLLGWVNYTPIFFKPSTECAVVGGRWWLVAAEGGRPRVLRGRFGRGTVRWDQKGKLAAAEVGVRLGGRGGEGRLAAALNHLPFPPRIGGALRLPGASGP